MCFAWGCNYCVFLSRVRSRAGKLTGVYYDEVILVLVTRVYRHFDLSRWQLCDSG